MNSGPVVLAELLPGTVAEMGRRAARADFERWQAQAQGCGHCSRPIRLRGSTTTYARDGRVIEEYDSRSEPDGVTYIRCGNRRAAVCPSCSHEYQGDMWHLLFAGVAGGIKDVPATVAEHPLAFVTLTAPGFGPVHTTRGPGRTCQPGRTGRCRHGRPAGCPRVHRDTDPDLGSPLCSDCYDYGGQIAFNWYAPELWRRFTIALRRRLAEQLDIPRSKLAQHLAVSFSKVAEFQRRGVIHFHALVRLDGPGDGYPAPTLDVTPEQLRDAITTAAAGTSVTTDPYEHDSPVWRVRFGDQIDVRPVNGHANRDASAGPMHPEMVAAYIAKYATKAADDFGLTAHRLDSHTDLTLVPVSDHIRRLLATAVRISAAAAHTIDALGADADAVGDDDTDNAALMAACSTWTRLSRWLHMLAFRGHFATKSRRYSVTLGQLRTERRTWRRRHETIELRDDADDLDESTPVVVRDWAFDGMGWLTTGDAALAASAACRARERRDAARLDRTADPDDR